MQDEGENTRFCRASLNNININNSINSALLLFTLHRDTGKQCNVSFYTEFFIGSLQCL